MRHFSRFLARGLPAVFSVVFACAASAAGFKVTFLMKSPGLPEDSQVYIVGSTRELGSWNPAKVRMDHAGGDTWRTEIVFDRALSIEYKYTLGSWEREAADTAGNAISNLVASIDGDREIADTVAAWTNGPRKRVNHGQITGAVRYHRSVAGEGIPARDIIVWLPPGYEADVSARYPVLYMHDGQNIIDPVTSSFGVDWSVDESLDRLIREKSVPPVIVVGVAAGEKRMLEYTPGENGTAYMDYLVNTVKPLIDANYRTSPDRRNTFVGGSSAGGIMSFMLVWEHPDVFSGAICMSPAFRPPPGYDERWNYVKSVSATESPRRDVFFYIDNGGIGLDSELQHGVDEMLAALKEKGYAEGRDYAYVVDAQAKHFEAAWAERFPRAVTLLLKRE